MVEETFGGTVFGPAGPLAARTTYGMTLISQNVGYILWNVMETEWKLWLWLTLIVFMNSFLLSLLYS